VTRRPRVALITGIAGGGAFVRIARWLMKGFDEIGVPFDVVYIEGPPGEKTYGSSREIHLGTEFARRSVRAFARYLEDARPAFTLVSPEFLAPYALLAGRMAKQPVIPWEASFLTFGLEDLPFRKRALPTLQRITYPWAPIVTAVSSDLLEHIKEHLGVRGRKVRYEVLPNPVDVDEVVGRAGDVAGVTPETSFCAIGRLTVHKGFDVLVEAADLLRRESSDPFRVSILGEGPRRQELETQIAQRGLRDVVHLPGHVDNPYPSVAAATAVVHPARREGFGLVVVEALALGVPVIATTCPGGPKEILDPTCSILVPPEDAGALADAMKRVASERLLRARLAEAGPSRARDYLPARVAQHIVALSES